MEMSTLLKLATRIPFGKWKGHPNKLYKHEAVAGTMIDQPVDPVIAKSIGKTEPAFYSQSDVGVVGYPFIPSIGISKDATSAINASMLKEVGDIAEQAKVSFISNIDPQDLGFMYTAIESALLCYTHGTRIYSFYKAFSRENLYSVKGYYKAMHVDYDDMLSHIPDLLTKLNWYKHDMDKLYLPKKFSAFQDHFKATANIFKDCELDKSTDIVEYPKGYWKYKPGVPALEWIEVDGRDHAMTFQEWCDIMDELLQALIGDEDVSNLTAYLKKAYSPNEVWNVNSMDWGALSELKYDLEEVQALHHACFLNYSDVQDMDIVQVITQDVEFRIQWNPTFTVPSLGCNAKRVYDIKNNEPTELEVANASRYMFTVKVLSANGNGGTIQLGSCGTMIFANPHIIIFDNEMNLKEVPAFTEFIPVTVEVTQGGVMQIICGFPSVDGYAQVGQLNSLMFFTQYHAAPITNLLTINGESAGPERGNKLSIYNSFFTKYNHVTVEDEVLDKILEAMIANAWSFDKNK